MIQAAAKLAATQANQNIGFFMAGLPLLAATAKASSREQAPHSLL
jgi:hypothetical protein